MAVISAILPFSESAPTRDIRARMPPSPRLSARITKRQYFTEMVTISVQTMSDRIASALPGVKWPVEETTVCSV